jgi:hypothetical protein
LRGIVLAWAVGLGLMSWREVQQTHRPPVPGRLLGASFVFMALALVAEYQPATRAAVLAAWGFDLAVLFQIGPLALVSTQGFRTSSDSPLAGVGGNTSGPPPRGPQPGSSQERGR